MLLAAGASPAMVVGEGEAEYFAGIASALSVNVGTPYEARIETMKKAIRGALAAGKPWVLDPVAAGGIPWRDKIIFELLEMHPTAVRGNASEIRFLAGVGTGAKEWIVWMTLLPPLKRPRPLPVSTKHLSW